MKKILIVENEKKLIDLMIPYLKKEGFDIDFTAKGSEAINKIKKSDFDVVILDVMLDDLDGWVVCKSIKEHSSSKIMILSARQDEEDKVFGYSLGADDYMTKPFSLKEMVLRVNKVMNMNHKSKSAVKLIEKNYEVIVLNEKIKTTKLEFDLLNYFNKNAGIVLTREDLLRNVWGYLYEGDTRTVDTTIKRLRKKLKPINCIHTIFGIGYKFEVNE
jgi:two-component system response regulator ResD